MESGPHAAMMGAVWQGTNAAMMGVVRQRTHAACCSVVYCRMRYVVKMTVVQVGELAMELNLYLY